MNGKKARKLRKQAGYNPSEDKTRYKVINKRTDERGNVTGTRVCIGKRAEYLQLKRSV